MLGSSMVDALDTFVSSNQVTPAAAKMVGLLNAKEAGCSGWVAAEAAAAAATAAAAPASQGVLQARTLSSAAEEISNGVAAGAAVCDPHAAKQQQHASLKSSTQEQIARHNSVGHPAKPEHDLINSRSIPGDASAASPLMHCSSSNAIKQQAQSADMGPGMVDEVAGFTLYTCHAASKPSQGGGHHADGAYKPSLCGGLGMPTADAEDPHENQLQQQELHQQREFVESSQSSNVCSPSSEAAPAAGARQLQPQGLSSLYGLALGASVCMADLIRQVKKCHISLTSDFPFVECTSYRKQIMQTCLTVMHPETLQV